MRKIIFVLLSTTLSFSCTSSKIGRHEIWNYSLFSSKINSASDIIERWGPPSKKEAVELDNQKTTVYVYVNKRNHNVAKFFIDPPSSRIIEKAYFPHPNEEEFSLKKLKNKYFPQIIFEKIAVKCRHQNEILLVNRDKGLFIVTEEEKGASVYRVVSSTKMRIESSLKKMALKKCRYR